jgi:hypothetical protein
VHLNSKFDFLCDVLTALYSCVFQTINMRIFVTNELVTRLNTNNLTG